MNLPFSSPHKIRKFVLSAGFLIFCFGLNYWLWGERIAGLVYDVGEYRYASLPVTPPGELERWVGTDKIVRLRVKLSGEPAITDSAGDKLAYKSVVQSREARGITFEDDWWWTPSQMEASAGATPVTLDLQHETLDHGFVPERAKGKVRNQTIPPTVAALVAPDFPKLEPYENDDIAVYTLNQGALVTVFGVVEKSGGRFIIHAPKHPLAARLIVSPLSDARLNSHLMTGIWALGFSAAVIVLTFAGIFALAVRNQRKAQCAAQAAIPPQPPDAWHS